MHKTYHPVAIFGIQFSKDNDAREFITKNSDIVLDEDESTYEQFIEFFTNGITWIRIDLYNTQDCILGFPMKLGDTIDAYLEMWNATFPNAEVSPKPILSVYVE